MPQCEVTDNGTRCTADGKLYKTHTFCKDHKEDYRGYIRMYQWAAEDLQKTSGAIAVFTARLPTFDTPEHLSAPADFLLYYLIAFDREIHWRRKHNDTFFGGGALPHPSQCDPLTICKVPDRPQSSLKTRCATPVSHLMHVHPPEPELRPPL